MRFPLALALAAGFALPGCALFARQPAEPEPLPPEVVASAAPALTAQLEAGMAAFNRGDMAGYVADLAPKVSYNGLTVDRARLLELNKDLKQDFPDVAGRYESIHVRAGDAGDLVAHSKAVYHGSTQDYYGSGLPATYDETAQLAARYRPAKAGYVSGRMTLVFNDAVVKAGEPFGYIGPSELPVFASARQPYALRLVTGHDQRGARVAFAYGLLPLEAMVVKGKGEEAVGKLRDMPVPSEGLSLPLRMPETAGTYVHFLRLTKLVPGAETILGQVVYTRLVRVE